MYPFTIPEFEEIASKTNIANLAVENVTHWKEDHAPFYHEFITVKTAPAQVTSETPLPQLRTGNTARPFNWDLTATQGLTFRIDRGQRARNHKPQHVLSLERDPVDLVEIMQPDVLPAPDGIHNVFEGHEFHIGLNWTPFFPIISLDRVDREPASYNDLYSLRVRDFVYFLKRHKEHAKVYTLFEWNCWGLASSLIRFTWRYRLARDFCAVTFPGDRLPLTDAEWPKSKKLLKLFVPRRMRVRQKGRRSAPSSYEAAWRADYDSEGGAFLDQFVFGPMVGPFPWTASLVAFGSKW